MDIERVREVAYQVLNKLFLVWTWLQLYYLGTIYMAKEIDRKLFRVLSTIRDLNFERDLPASLAGRRAVVTGGTRGIGLVTVKELLARGCHVVVASSGNRAGFEAFVRRTREEVRVDLKAAGKDPAAVGLLEVHPLDLTSMAAVNTFADRILKEFKQLNLLILNAGIMFTPYRRTADGLESQMAVNYFGPVLLTWRLLPLLNATGLASGQRSRIVAVSSSTHFVGGIRLEDIHGERIYSPYFFYAQSKLAEVMFCYKFHRFLTRHDRGTGGGPAAATSSSGSGGDNADQVQNLAGVQINCLHPGIILTDLYAHVWWVKAFPWIPKYTFRSLRTGAETTLYAALSPELEGVGGKYLEDCVIRSSSGASYSQDTQDRLWRLTWEVLKPHMAADQSGRRQAGAAGAATGIPDPTQFVD